ITRLLLLAILKTFTLHLRTFIQRLEIICSIIVSLKKSLTLYGKTIIFSNLFKLPHLFSQHHISSSCQTIWLMAIWFRNYFTVFINLTHPAVKPSYYIRTIWQYMNIIAL